jgi:hypothetical protein
VWKYQESLKRYYNKSVVQRELNIADLVLKKYIHTKDKHKFSSPSEGLFIIVDIAALGAYVLANTMPDVFIWLIKIYCFTSYKNLHVTLSSGPSTEEAHQPNNQNDKPKKRDDAFLIWLDALPQPSIR